MVDYVEDPIGRLVSVHWADDDDEPPEPEDDPDCKGGTWELMLDSTPGGVSFVDIHDAMAGEGGLEGNRHIDLTDPLFDYSFLRVMGSTAEFGTPPPPQTPPSIFGFYCRGCKTLKIEASSQPGPALEPPPTPPFPKYPAYVGEPATPAMAYSQMTSRWTMPPYPPDTFQSSWDYDNYSLEGRAGGSPFDPSSGGAGVFYFRTEGGSSTMSEEYAAWYAYYFEGIGSDPGFVVDQFYTAGFHGYIIHIKLTFIC